MMSAVNYPMAPLGGKCKNCHSVIYLEHTEAPWICCCDPSKAWNWKAALNSKTLYTSLPNSVWPKTHRKLYHYSRLPSISAVATAAHKKEAGMLVTSLTYYCHMAIFCYWPCPNMAIEPYWLTDVSSIPFLTENSTAAADRDSRMLSCDSFPWIRPNWVQPEL